MSFVLDCSVTMAWISSDEAKEGTGRLRESLIAGSAFVPSLWPVAVANVLLMATRRGLIARNAWHAIVADLRALQFTLIPIPRIGCGVRRSNLRTHIGSRCTVAASDRNLAQGARSCGAARHKGLTCYISVKSGH